MWRPETLGWLGGLVVLAACGGLLVDQNSHDLLRVISRLPPRQSPMDMPDWYREPLLYGSRFEGGLPANDHSERSAAVRGFW